VLTAGSGSEATAVIRDQPVHIAVVDLALPMGASDNPSESRDAGLRILELLARLDQPPPTVVIRRRCTPKEGSRGLASALAAGAFAVVDRPVQLETVLDIMRRVVRRHYADQWPSEGTN
jgi:CheY-like chemotaxis protein